MATAITGAVAVMVAVVMMVAVAALVLVMTTNATVEVAVIGAALALD